MGIAAEWGARVATGYQVPVLVERSRRLRSETRLRYDQSGRSRRLRSDRGHDTFSWVRTTFDRHNSD